ncbi:DMSO/TMAO reductase YedYZ heme-binding membrane subunit [Allocatelliglobosispora scoriae]|uniref:DMSO/TMAO reductase YedYZ heme-binding membrane subunit n=1 Tax=Allocatelliglobosispora scoriae TaxID=643052 RepID=A0A841C1M3_9ACTN|nr:hypothetical protein [Allocatelliglobosispora scoriae]MBB5872870.1 DMSO/TMAO reductase YedYZ heme-binding membrane subunit [Allocatelliglobosispora scoriae]
MTTPSQPAGSAARDSIRSLLQPSGSAGDAIKSLRTLFVWAMLAYVAAILFFEFFRWVLPTGYSSTFASRSANADFTTLTTLALPLVAVLLATVVQPALGIGKLACLAALGLYVFMLFFDGITFLIGLGSVFDGVGSASGSLSVLAYVVIGLFDLVWVVLAGFAVFKIFTAIGGKLNVGNAAPVA